jgi:CheY-like chemotaxis protein
VSRLIDEMLTLLTVSISKRATLRTDLGAGLPLVLGNKTQLRQVVMNLVLNASEAIEEGEGTVRIATSSSAAPLNGEDVRIEITDTGGGMTEEARSRIFERTFTTKAGARGMGLAVVRGIVRAHGGMVKVSSTPGQGTTFDVLLPSAGQVAGRGFWASPASMLDAIPAGGATVLLIEKEDHLRASIAKTLGRTGFSVLPAPDDEVALDILRNHPMDIDAVILDLTPGRSGLEVLKQVRQVRGRVPIVLTGSGTQVEGHHGGPGLSFLPKPYRVDRLVRQLRRAMALPRPDRNEAQAAAASSGTRTGESWVNSATIAGSVASPLKEQGSENAPQQQVFKDA